MRWNPPACDHNSRPAAVRRVPTPSAHDRTVNRKNAANGRPHSGDRNADHRKKPHTANSNAITLAVRTHSSFLRLTIRPLSKAHFSTALAMSVLALFSFSPDLTVFFASNSSPRPVHLQRDTDLAADGIDAAPIRTCSARPRTLQCSSLTCFSSISSAFGEIEQRRGEGVLRDGFGADVLGLHRPEAGRRRVLQREPGRRLDRGAVPEEAAERRHHRQAQDPHHAGQRPAQDPIPGVGPRQFRRAAASARRHRRAPSPVCAAPDSSPRARPCCR